MAWAGIFLGMIAGLCAAVLGYAALGLPVWLSLLMYPAAGTAVAILAVVTLAWRGTAAMADTRAESRRSKTAAA
ncbi:hypothetical protein ACFMBG_08415 [Leisingera sp. D0M16]|uniref:hypothetical protein n=1 Tax=Leisingera coralii TaxID=3351347 RepID=UPI003B81D0DE